MGKRSKKAVKTRGQDSFGVDDHEESARLEDRFAAAETRPHFRTPKPSTSKVVLDDRFSSVLTDTRFQLQEKDRYGRKKTKSKQREAESAAKEELKSFYVVRDNDDDEKREKTGRLQPEKSKKQSQKEADENHASDSDSDGGDDGKVEDPESRIAYLRAFSRGELDVSSSSDDGDSSQSSDEDGDGGDDGEDPVYGKAGVLDPSSQRANDVEISYDPSPYLVVTNMDWENIRAVDLFSILSSFAPPGAVKRVQVLQSDFGIERMSKDKLHGPADIWVKKMSQKAHAGDHSDGSSDEESKSSDENSEDSDNIEAQDEFGLRIEEDGIPEESDFDPEKLRAYEASKLKYFFALAEFSKPEHADMVYREVDGMEFEHSSATIDLRTVPPEEVVNVVMDRPLRDEATSVPGNYEPPEFVISALQQTNVQCTWDQGDAERERKLTKYGSTGWQDMVEADDLKAYLASDASSEDDSDVEGGANKGSRTRKLLGLDDDDDDGAEAGDSGRKNQVQAECDDFDSDDDDREKDEMSKEFKFIPGQKDLEEKIRSKLENRNEETKELTPWQKYEEKRKQKRKERRQGARGPKSGSELADANDEDVRDRKSKKEPIRNSECDDFFVGDDDDDDDQEAIEDEVHTGKPKAVDNERTRRIAKDELELLLAGDHDEEQKRDYDIRGIQRLEKNRGKKLKGSRKRWEAKVEADVSGTNFKVNVEDDRFRAVLDGNDGRYGIDKTDPNYKDTPAMRDILSEQTKRRKKKRQKTHESVDEVVPDVDVNNAVKTSGANALSSLVKRLKSRVQSNTIQ